MIVKILIIFIAIFGTINAQSAECDYSIQYFWATGYLPFNNSYYSCYLYTYTADFLDKVSKIDGNHNSGYQDIDVGNFFIPEGNDIKTFSSTFCDKFRNLKVVRTFHADIRSIDKNSLENCENLDVLDLAGTQIRYLPNKLLIKNTKLSQIWIRENPLATLPEDLFVAQGNLKILSAKQNQLNFLPARIFDPLVNLQGLYLEINKLKSINPEWFKNLRNLKWLALNENQIVVVPARSFASLTNLEELYIYKNQISSLNANCFDGLHNLKILNLYGNEISELLHNVFTPLTNLQELSLYDNKLTVIHAASFGVHKKLTDIYLGSNRINRIDERFIDNTAVNYINMENNVCSQSQLKGIENIKSGLRTCFVNYKKNIQSVAGSAIKATRARDCGRAVKGHGNIVGGKFVERGDYPWVAALVTPSGQFFCGGTLVTTRKVLTAAHCIQDKHEPRPKLAREIVIQLGVYDLSKSVEVGRIPYAVQKINVHPDWNTLTEPFDADLAVLVLDREVIFSEYIQPVCFVDIEVPTVVTGVVVGYGKSEDETKIHENIPKIIETPIHTNEHCFLDHYSLIKLSSKRTFCGGTGTGVGVCRGDSGSGLFVNDGSVYYLRGIVSSSIIGGPYGCDVNTYSVFTDVTKYADWISGVSVDRFD